MLPQQSGTGEPSESDVPTDQRDGRIISFSTLSRPTRWLIILAACLLVCTGALLALQAAPFPRIAVSTTDTGALIDVPVPVFLLTTIIAIFGWSSALAGAFLLSRWGRLLLVSVSIGMLAIGPVLRLSHIAPADARFANATFGLCAAELGALACLLVWTLAGGMVARQRAARQDDLFVVSFLPIAIFVCAYFLIDNILLARAGPVAGVSAFSGSTLAVQITFFPIILAIFIYWGSTDFIEWGQTIATGAISVVQRVRIPALLFSLLALVAIADLFDVLRRYSLMSRFPALAVAVVALLALALSLRLARVSESWPGHVPVGAAITGAVFLALVVQVAGDIIAPLTSSLHIPPEWVNPTLTLIVTGLSGLLILTGIVMIWRGRSQGPASRSAAGVFLIMVALVVISRSVPSLANILGLPVVASMQPDVVDYKLLVASGLLGGMIWLAVRWRLTSQHAAPLLAAAVALAGLQVIGWYFQWLLPALNHASTGSIAIAALLFVGALIWDFVMSGEQVTNRSSTEAPRTARVLVYLSYTLLAGATFLYIATQRLAGTGSPLPLQPGIPLNVIGVEGLGLPLIAFALARTIGGQPKARHGTTTQGTDSPEGELTHAI